jgi:aspartate/methionine/tyrosine aminotransferase
MEGVSKMLEYLSERGKKWVRTLPPLVKAHFDNFYNMYDKETNPKGLVNMGTAESHLVNKEVCNLLRKSAEHMDLTGYNIHYNKFEGSDEFRTAIANHWQKIIFGEDRNVVLGKEQVATCAGCTVALETLATLLAEPGDAFLIPAPYYSSFVDDINERAGVLAVGVPCDETLSRDAFEKAYEKLTREGKRVRAVLFSSPNNPIGIVYKEEAVRGLLDFAMDHDLDVISDEIYAQTVFDSEADFVSTMKLVPASYRHRVHVTSSFAKDFVLSGFRTGMCFSFNPSIIQGFASITYYSSVSSHTQSLLTALLGEPELGEIMELSRRRLAKAYHIFSEGLADMGIPTMKSQAGIFVMADFSDYLEKQEFAAEHVLWEKIYNELMINVSPGQLFGCDRPGWFRACYAFDEDTVEEACRRLRTLKKVN